MNDKGWNKWVMQTARDWDDIKYVVKETGIAPVDHDHKRLTLYILELNILLVKLDREFSLELVEQQHDLLNHILKYMAGHFSREEKFIKKYGIPGLEEQKREHRKILSMIKKQLFQFQTGRISTGHRLRVHLLEWVVFHINQTDYKIFSLQNMGERIVAIEDWDDLKDFIRTVHIPQIDFDHRILTESIISLSRSIVLYRNNEDPELLGEIRQKLNRTLAITREHFDHEIKLIETYSIGGVETQDTQHRRFVGFLENHLELFEKGDTRELGTLEKELMIWWISHINIYDYSTFRKSNWTERVLLEAKDAQSVIWLISRTGEAVIDEDHKHFVELLFECSIIFREDSFSSGNMEEASKELIRLRDYAQHHFAREEEIIKCSYPDHLLTHKQEHKAILKELDQQHSFLKQEMIYFTPLFRKKLLHLWISHTNGTDLDTFGVSYEG